jgi:glycosyltransferase involved in cell wall biosynthesis
MKKTLSIIIPLYNEEETIIKIIHSIHKTPLSIEKEIIVIDDASTDSSFFKVCAIKETVTHVIRHKKNKGKGAAIQTGLNVATGDFVVIQDADLEYSPRDYQSLINTIESEDCDIVYGSRFLKKNDKEIYFLHKKANKLLTWLSNKFTGFRLTDMETCYKLMPRHVYTSLILKEKKFGIEPEITAKLSKKKLRIKEVPINYTPRTYEAGKKIKLKDGIRAVYCIIKYSLIN